MNITESIFASIVSLLTSFVDAILPDWSLNNFPLLDDNDLLYDTLLSAMQAYNAVIETIPYLALTKDVFIAILGVEIFLLALKFFVGSRSPIAVGVDNK